jgi:hypothetical protein
MDPISIIALTLGVGWAAGINLYAAVLTLGLMHAFGAMSLPPDLEILSAPIVLLAAAFMYVLEFGADKIPGIDSGWDAIHTFIRIPAGAVLAARAVGDVDPVLMLAAALVGGTLAAGSHFTKASARLMINTSPEPFSNWAASVAEDVAVIGGLWIALHNPILFLVLLGLVVVAMAWALPKILRLIGRVIASIAAWFRGNGAQPSPR